MYYLCFQDNKNMKNKIIVFSNIKGGVGKSTLCAMFATFATEKGIAVGVVDADLQQSLIRQRQREMESDSEIVPPWKIINLDTTSENTVKKTIEKLKKFSGLILIDSPGNLNDSSIKPVFEAADIACIPISYEDIIIDATSVFISVFRKISDAHILFIPNRINETEGTKEEKEMRMETIKILGKIGLVTPRIKQSVVIKRFSTIYNLDKYQSKAVEYAFDSIIKEIKK